MSWAALGRYSVCSSEDGLVLPPTWLRSARGPSGDPLLAAVVQGGGEGWVEEALAVQHTQLLGVLEVCPTGGGAMAVVIEEAAGGATLASCLEGVGPAVEGEEAVWGLLIGAMQGLAALHVSEHVHGALSPASIIVNTDEPPQHPLTARLLPACVSPSPQDAPPEGHTSFKADIWALGKAVGAALERACPSGCSYELKFLVQKMTESVAERRPTSRQVMSYAAVKSRVQQRRLQREEKRVRVVQLDAEKKVTELSTSLSDSRAENSLLRERLRALEQQQGEVGQLHARIRELEEDAKREREEHADAVEKLREQIRADGDRYTEEVKALREELDERAGVEVTALAMAERERDLEDREKRLCRFLEMYRLTKEQLSCLPADGTQTKLFCDYYHLPAPDSEVSGTAHQLPGESVESVEDHVQPNLAEPQPNTTAEASHCSDGPHLLRASIVPSVPELSSIGCSPQRHRSPSKAGEWAVAGSFGSLRYSVPEITPTPGASPGQRHEEVEVEEEEVPPPGQSQSSELEAREAAVPPPPQPVEEEAKEVEVEVEVTVEPDDDKPDPVHPSVSLQHQSPVTAPTPAICLPAASAVLGIVRGSAEGALPLIAAVVAIAAGGGGQHKGVQRVAHLASSSASCREARKLLARSCCLRAAAAETQLAELQGLGGGLLLIDEGATLTAQAESRLSDLEAAGWHLRELGKAARRELLLLRLHLAAALVRLRHGPERAAAALAVGVAQASAGAPVQEADLAADETAFLRSALAELRSGGGEMWKGAVQRGDLVAPPDAVACAVEWLLKAQQEKSAVRPHNSSMRSATARAAPVELSPVKPQRSPAARPPAGGSHERAIARHLSNLSSRSPDSHVRSGSAGGQSPLERCWINADGDVVKPWQQGSIQNSLREQLARLEGLKREHARQRGAAESRRRSDPNASQLSHASSRRSYADSSAARRLFAVSQAADSDIPPPRGFGVDGPESAQRVLDFSETTDASRCHTLGTYSDLQLSVPVARGERQLEAQGCGAPTEPSQYTEGPQTCTDSELQPTSASGVRSATQVAGEDSDILEQSRKSEERPTLGTDCDVSDSVPVAGGERQLEA
eukprot:Hpha_TRINITY_DN11667_c0_g1::TRINITY_DN11667_c0_g1_i2::g.49381::m.49381